MSNIIIRKIQLKRGFLKDFLKDDPVLDVAEPAYVRDKKLFKIGDGSTKFSDLPYQSVDSTIISQLTPLLDALIEVKDVQSNLSSVKAVQEKLNVISTINSNLTELQNLASELQSLVNINTHLDKIKSVNLELQKILNVEQNIGAVNTVEQNMSAIVSVKNNINTILEAVQASVDAQAIKDSLEWRGVYDGAETYAKDNRVSYEGSSYISLQDGNTGNTPVGNEADTWWDVIAEKGVDGDTVIINSSGNWEISGTDTGVQAEGVDGVGIESIVLHATSGLDKTYRITFTDASTFDFVVSDGEIFEHYYQDTPPESPKLGDFWTDSSSGSEFVYLNDGDSEQWVEFGNTSAIGNFDIGSADDVDLGLKTEGRGLLFDAQGNLIESPDTLATSQEVDDKASLLRSETINVVNNEDGNVETISGSIRVQNGSWSFIEDASHTPVGFQDVVLDASGQPRVRYNKVYSKVISLLCVVDETYAKKGITVGASVGLQNAVVQLYKNNIGFYIQWNGSNWQIIGDNYNFVNSTSYDNETGRLTISHKDIGADGTFDSQVTGRNDTLLPVSGGVGATSVQIFFKNPDGTTYTGSPTTGMRAFVKRGGSIPVDIDSAEINGSNIWITGYMVL